MSVFALFVIVIIGTGYHFYQGQKRQLLREEIEKLHTVANLKAGQIEQWRRERLGDAQVLAATPFLAEHIRHLIDHPLDAPCREKLRHWLQEITTRHHYLNALLLDQRGRVLLRAHEDGERIGPGAEALIAEVMASPKVLFSDLYQGPSPKILRLSLLAPVLEQQGDKTVLVGILFFRINPHQFFFPLIQSWPVPSDSAETLLVRLEGQEVVYLNELRHQKETALSLRFPLTRTELPAVQAVLGRQGIIRGLDCRGVKVVATARPIAGSPWVLVAKVDEGEILAELRRYAVIDGAVVSALILAAGLVLVFIWRRQQMYHLDDLARREGEEKEKLEAILSAVPDLIFLLDRPGRFLFANQAAVGALALEPAEPGAAEPGETRLPPPLAELVGPQAESVFLSGTTGRGEVSFSRRDEARFYDYTLTPLTSGEGAVSAVLITMRDITPRKLAEEKLSCLNHLYAALSRAGDLIVRERQAEQLYEHFCRLAVEEGGLGFAWVGVVDPENQELKSTAAWGRKKKVASCLGCSVREASVKKCPTLEVIRSGRISIFQDLQNQASTFSWQDASIACNYSSLAVFPLRVAGQVIGAMNYYSTQPHYFTPDKVELLERLTAYLGLGLEMAAKEEERRRASDRLVQEKQFSDTVIETLPGLFYLYDDQQRLLRWNKNMEQVTGYTVEELAGKRPFDFFQEPDRSIIRQRVEEVWQRGEAAVEAELVTKEGRRIPYFFTGRRALIGGKPCLLGTGIDITELRRAQKALARHSTRLQTLVDLHSMADHQPSQLLDFILETSLAAMESEFAFIGLMNEDETIMTIHRWSKEAMEQCALIEKPFYFPIAEAGVWGEAVRRRQPLVVNDYHAPHPAKKGLPPGHVPIERLLTVPVLEAGRVVAVAAVANKASDYTDDDVTAYTTMLNKLWDILRRRQIEDALRESEEKYRRLVQTIPAVVAQGYADWSMEVFDEKVEDLTGYPMEAFNSRQVKWKDLILPEDLPQVQHIFREALANHTPYVREYRIRTRQGDIRWLQERSQILFTDSGRIKCVSGVLFDISDRVAAEESLKASLREKEVLLKEIHHRVKNNMQIISSLLRLQAEQARLPEVQQVFQESQNRIRSMAVVHEMLYLSPRLASISLAAYLKNLVHGLFLTYRVNPRQIRLTFDVADLPVGIDLALACGLIVTELVSNSLKHAFPDHQPGELGISGQEISPGEMELRVWDSGVGLPADIDPQKTSSLGLRLVTLLVGQLKGSLSRGEGPGANFVIRFSVKENYGNQKNPDSGR